MEVNIIVDIIKILMEVNIIVVIIKILMEVNMMIDLVIEFHLMNYWLHH